MAASSTERVRALRARRAAGIEAGNPPPLRDVSELMLPVVEASIAALALRPEDQAAARLAREYAAVIDAARDRAAALRAFGPPLARLLRELRATPASRASGRSVPGAAGPARPNRVAELRAAHAAAKARIARGA